jgi:hypothetical protein
MTSIPMQDEERKTMREHIVFLGSQLEAERKNNLAKTELLRRFMDREDLGWAVSDEVRSLAYQLLTEEYLRARNEEKHNDD